MAIFWTIWGASLCYVLALASGLLGRERTARALWISGAILYLAHVWAAFAIRHAWSHRAAFEETARQTEQLFGMHWGGGIYWNYLFTAVWTLDALWLAFAPDRYRIRPRRLNISIHVFLAFMFFNAAIVFPSGWIRWAGLVAAAILIVIRFRSR